MTDNEKAATFIGYELSWCDATLYTVNGKFECTRCDRRWKKGELGYSPHERPAPDMTDPRNYMEALKSLPKLGFDVDIEYRPNNTLLRISRRASYAKQNVPWRALGRNTPVEALAALYDAEHKS